MNTPNSNPANAKAGPDRDAPTRVQNLKNLLAGMAADAAELRRHLGRPVTETVAGWLAPQYVAAAHEKLAAAEGTQRFELLRVVVQDLTLLRRGDHWAVRLQLDRDKLDWLRATGQEEKEKEFWERLEQPEIRAKVFPHRKPGIRPATLDKIIRELNL